MYFYIGVNCSIKDQIRPFLFRITIVADKFMQMGKTGALGDNFIDFKT
jgi:hypothetical protein